MKWSIVLLVLIVRMIVVSLNAAPEFAQHHILVKFKPEITAKLRAANLNEKLNELLAELALPSEARLTEPALNQLLRAQRKLQAEGVRPDVHLDRFLYLQLPPDLSPEEAVRRLSEHPWVEYAETDGIGAGGLIPNDPNFSNQWHHHNTVKPTASIQTPMAWDMTQGSANVVVAVLDTGLSASVEFTGRLLLGYNFANTNGNTADDHGHGTAVAGTIAANANNSALVAGVDWHCRLLPVKVLDANNYGLYSWWAQGIDFAVSNGAKVINLSAGGNTTSSTLTRAITNALAKGTIFITITQNDGSNAIKFPGNLVQCITVGATDAQDRRATFSNYGPQIDLCAPGTNIYTVSRSGALTYWWGTSFAAPQVAGVSALLAALRPGISHEEARLLLCLGAEDEVGDATDAPGFDNFYGWGRLNAFNSLLLAQTKVDRIDWTLDMVQLSWPSPANASNKQPYLVEFKDALGDTWQAASLNSEFEYTTNRTFWRETAQSSFGRFYRVRLRSLP